MTCEMIKPATATVLVVYIAVVQNPLLVSHASHFVDTFASFPSNASHHLLVVSNGGHLPPKMKDIFKPIPHEFYPRTNDGGWDVSAYIEIARRFHSDLQVCLGESVYFHREGWLSRLMECFNQHGPGMYGFLSSYLVRPHLNTTAFAVSPAYLRDYPWPSDRLARYAFEHGEKSLWRRIAFSGGATKLVTWDGCWQSQDWRKPDNILWRGDQSNCLVHCNHTDKFISATQPVRERWTRHADAICV